MRLPLFAIAVLLPIALINGFGVSAKKKRPRLGDSLSRMIETTNIAVEQTTPSPAVETKASSPETVADATNVKPKEAVQQRDAVPPVNNNNAMPVQPPVEAPANSAQPPWAVPSNPAQLPVAVPVNSAQPPIAGAQEPQVTVGDGRAAPVQAMPMYYPPFPFYFPFINPSAAANPGVAGGQQMGPFVQGQSMGMQSQSQVQPGMVSLSQIGPVADENGQPSRLQAPFPVMFYNIPYSGYNQNYGSYQPNVAYREVYYPSKATGAPQTSTETVVDVVTEKPTEGKALKEEKKEEKLKCKAPAILYHANVKPLSTEKQKNLSWLKDPKSDTCKEPFLICECDNNGKTERRWSFDQQSNKCVLYEDPCPGKNKNSFTALNECLVSCWRM